MDLLTRRVAHRLGCPVATGQVQQGVLHLDAPLRQLHAKGAREVVIAPLMLTAAPISLGSRPGRGEGPAHLSEVSLRQAEPLGGAPELIHAAMEALNNSERTPSTDTRIVLLVPHLDHPVLPGLSTHIGAVAAAGWRDGVVTTLPPNNAKCGLNGALDVGAHERVLLVPLTVAPGPFSSRVAECADLLGVESANVSLHSAEALTRLICQRVNTARRA
ncbi:MAG: hypothetical protein QG597_4370 [Actinomycetota bacterium]|nr:hypothetical protein [Actinomycetota bacterium]